MPIATMRIVVNRHDCLYLGTVAKAAALSIYGC